MARRGGRTLDCRSQSGSANENGGIHEGGNRGNVGNGYGGYLHEHIDGNVAPSGGQIYLSVVSSGHQVVFIGYEVDRVGDGVCVWHVSRGVGDLASVDFSSAAIL